MSQNIGVKQEINDEILSRFASVEGFNSVYYGKTRQGKTRTATADILELLKRGETVVANWNIEVPEYDERTDFMAVFVRFIFRKDLFFKYKKENFYYIDPIKLIDGTGEQNVSWLNKLVDAHVFIDEGQWVLPSLDRSFSPDVLEKMKLVLHGGHYCRSLNIITQRHQNISKNTRSQINVWHRCVKRFDIFGYILFQRWSIEDMKNDEPVEFDEEDRAVGTLKSYLAHKATDPVFKAYNTHGMREKDAIELPRAFEAYSLTSWDKFKLLVTFLIPARLLKGRAGDNSNTD